MNKVWIAERDWGDGRIEFLGVFSHRVRAIAGCEKAELSMPGKATNGGLIFEKVEGHDSWVSHVDKNYTYCIFEAVIDD